MAQETQTLIIDNFKGKLTKSLLGDVNSGLCPVSLKNFGFNPFWSIYDNSLSFLPAVSNIAGGTISGGPLLGMISYEDSNFNPLVYAVGISGTIYVVTASSPQSTNPDFDAITIFTNNPTTYTAYKGGSILISSISGVKRLYAGGDGKLQISSGLVVNASTWTTLSGLTTDTPTPMVEFLGKLYFGNGSNIAESTDGYSTFSSAAKLSPSIPADYVFRDLAVSADGRYLIGIATQLSASFLDNSSPTHGNQAIYNLPNSVIILWNGIDSGYSVMKFIKGVNLSSIIVTNTYTAIFGNDDEGLAIYDTEGNRISQVFDSNSATYPPLNAQTFASGQKIFFLAQRGANIGLYCYNNADTSVYCLWQSDAMTVNTLKGSCCLPSNHATSYLTGSGVDLSRTRIYFSIAKIAIGTAANNYLYRMHTQNASESVQLGSYSTQVQKFAKKIKVGEIRVFCEPTIPSNAFTMYLTNSSGGTISSSTMSYAFAAGTDETQKQGALDVIKFNPTINATQSLGLQFNNTGTSSITVHKVEMDYVYAQRVNSKQ